MELNLQLQVFFFFFSRNSVLLSELLCNKHRHTTYFLQECSELLSSTLLNLCVYKHTAFCGWKELIQ